MSEPHPTSIRLVSRQEDGVESPSFADAMRRMLHSTVQACAREAAVKSAVCLAELLDLGVTPADLQPCPQLPPRLSRARRKAAVACWRAKEVSRVASRRFRCAMLRRAVLSYQAVVQHASDSGMVAAEEMPW